MNRELRALMGACIGAWALSAGTATAEDLMPFATPTRTLDNGLQVVVVPYDSPGLVAYWTVVRAGARNEVEPGHTGFAHFFEHMMFRGTESYSTAEYNAELQRLGADSNAYTSDDYTAYHILAPASGLEKLMELESDRFQNLSYTEEAFKTEARAVLGEYNKNSANPVRKLLERLRGTAYTTHTYAHTGMGYLEDILRMPDEYEYSLRFFDLYYRPDTAIVLIVGDVDAEATFALAERYYGGWKPTESERPEIPSEPPQEAARSAHVAWPNPSLPWVALAHPVPAFSTTDVDRAAVDLLAEVAFSASSPLYRELVLERRLVDVLSAVAPDRRDPNLFRILIRIKDESQVGTVIARLEEVLTELAETPISEERLARAKSHVRYDFAMSLDTADAVASTLAHYLQLTADPRSPNALYARLDEVTPEDVQRVAATYMTETTRTVVTLATAAPAPSAAAAATEGGVR